MVIRFRSKAVVVACAVLSVLASGCRDSNYADTINLNAGDAIARNKAVHTIDPWPRSAFRKRHATNGQRITKAYDKYQGQVPAEAPKQP